MFSRQTGKTGHTALRHLHGLLQAWGSTTYGMGLWGRSFLGIGRRAASKARPSALSKGRHRFTEGETLPWKNTHMGLPKENQAIRTPSQVQGLTGDPGNLTPVLGLASDCCYGDNMIIPALSAASRRADRQSRAAAITFKAAVEGV